MDGVLASRSLCDCNAALQLYFVLLCCAVISLCVARAFTLALLGRLHTCVLFVSLTRRQIR
jgi:hypothetical protein